MIETRCRRCGETFSPDRDAIAGGRWRLCPGCRETEPETRCDGCGRPLRTGRRTICGRCLGVAA